MSEHPAQTLQTAAVAFMATNGDKDALIWSQRGIFAYCQIREYNAFMAASRPADQVKFENVAAIAAQLAILAAVAAALDVSLLAALELAAKKTDTVFPHVAGQPLPAAPAPAAELKP